MLLHPQVVNKVIYLCTNYGGHASEKKLLDEINNIVLSPYQSDKIGICLVDTRTFLMERQQRRLPTNDIVPMRLHSTAVQKIMAAYQMFSGHSNETKLRNALTGMDLTPYERHGTAETVLVLTSDYMKTIQGGM